MDPRLKRWGLVGLAGMVIAAILLLPVGEPIMGNWSRWDPWYGLSPLARRQRIVEIARNWTEADLGGLKRQRYVRERLSDRRDPLVLSSAGLDAKTIAQVQQVADSIWATLPARRGDTRTVLDISRAGSERSGSTERDAEGNCIVDVGLAWSGWQTTSDIVRRSSGECLFREAFGAPGPSWERWLKRIPYQGFAWVGARPNQSERMIASDPETRPRAWFEFANDGMSLWTPWVFRGDPTPQIAYLACRAGRPDQCRAAYHVDDTAPDSTKYRDGYYSAATWKLPAALLTDLGPTKAAELWHTDLPISTAYARLAGRPIDPILTDVTMQASGPRLRETPLPLLAWLGMVIWVTLLLLWARERIRMRVTG